MHDKCKCESLLSSQPFCCHIRGCRHVVPQINCLFRKVTLLYSQLQGTSLTGFCWTGSKTVDQKMRDRQERKIPGQTRLSNKSQKHLWSETHLYTVHCIFKCCALWKACGSYSDMTFHRRLSTKNSDQSTSWLSSRKPRCWEVKQWNVLQNLAKWKWFRKHNVNL